MNLWGKNHHKSVLVLLDKMCSSVVEHSIFLCLKSKQSLMIRCWCCCLQHQSVLMTHKLEINSQKALKHVWQQLLKSSASQTGVERHCLCGERESSSPGLLHQNSHRHFILWNVGICIVTSGRLGAKRLRLSEFLSEGIFRVCGGIPTSLTSGVLFCRSWCFPQSIHNQQKKTRWDYLWKWHLIQCSMLKVRSCRNSPLLPQKLGQLWGDIICQEKPGRRHWDLVSLSYCSFRRELNAKMTYRISLLVSSYLVHQCFLSWLTSVTADIQASPWTTTLHKAPSTLHWEDGVAVCVQWGSGPLVVLLNTEDRHAAWWVLLWCGEGLQWGITVDCGVERLLRAQEGLRGSDCAAGAGWVRRWSQVSKYL